MKLTPEVPSLGWLRLVFTSAKLTSLGVALRTTTCFFVGAIIIESDFDPLPRSWPVSIAPSITGS